MSTTIAEFKQAFSTAVPREGAQADYEAARQTALAEFDDCFVQARLFDALEKTLAALRTKRREMEESANSGDYDAARQQANQLEYFVADYLKRAAAIQKNYDALGRKIIKEIEEACWFQEDDVARRWVEQLSDAQLKFLPARVRNRLLEELREGAFFGDEREATRKVYRCSTLDPAFENAERQLHQRFVDQLNRDPMITKARENWEHMQPPQKLKVLKRVADLHAAAYGTTKAAESESLSIEAFDEPPELDAGGQPTSRSYGDYSHSSGTIRFNIHPGLGLKSFNEALGKITHEAQHRYQCVLIDRLESGDLKRGDPEYDQAVTFQLNRGYYVDDWEDGYIFQPLEAHAHAVDFRIYRADIGGARDKPSSPRRKPPSK
jgi:hypothetical protein